MIMTDILLDGFFAAIAAIGFGSISNVPLQAFKDVHCLRQQVMPHVSC